MFTNAKRAIFAAVAATAAVAALAACDPQSSASSAPNRPDLASFAMPTSEMQIAPTTTAAPAVDPLSTDGMWLVGKDIPAGTYKVTPTSEFGGYWALCSDLSCDVGVGMIKNDLVNGPSYVVIPADAKAIKTDRIRLEAVSN